ncbi:alpha/beta fold hydrolase [Gymnodinialimonas hymeniacidonis]|uniref:alpha/beta fold hydrolase n=1 Tax=Gymnodinialimonas hymeniacidonis TaxID=3126508 RepID=UPI0034C6CA3D
MWGAGFVEVSCKRLEYRCWGPEPDDGRAIVLLHEGLGCVALWRDFPQRLQEATGLPVLAYSRAGYGQSDPDDLPRPLNWMTREAVEVLPQVLASFGLSQPILLGHSDGATIAAIYAGRQSLLGAPPLLAAVLMAPHFFTEEMGLAEIARAGEAFRTSDMAARMAKYHRDPEATFRGWADAWLDPEFREWNVEHALDGVTCPVLAIQGREDQYGTLAQIEVVSRRVATAQTMVLDACQHVPHLEQSEAVLEIIGQFMQKNA